MKVKKKLLLASFTSPLNHNGVSMAVARMENEMRIRDWEVYVTSCEPDDASIKIPHNHFTVPASFNNRINFSDPIINNHLNDWLDSIKTDIIVIHSWLGWPINILFFYATKNSIPLILMGHGFGAHLMHWVWKPPFFGLARWLRSWGFVWKMSRWIPQMASLVVLGKSPHFFRGVDHWLANQIRYNRIHTIPNAVKALPKHPLAFRAVHHLEGKLVLLCVAGFCQRKNQLLVLEAFKRAAIGNSVLVLIGPEKNDYSEKILAASKSLSSSVLVLVGLKRIEVESAIQACDVAILGSKSEMQPIFLLEAMSEGKPWICTKVGSVDELEGGLITGQSSRDIARAICQMNDPALRQKLGTMAKSQWQREFQPQTVYDKWNQVLSESP